MLAHRLKYQIEIWEETEVKDSIGSLVSTEQLVAAVFADHQASMGKVAANDDRILHTNETTFIIRNYPEMNYGHFVKYDGSVYTIIALQKLPDGSGQIIKTTRNA